MKNGKRLLSLFIAIVMAVCVFPVSAFAAEVIDSGTCGDDAAWTLTADGVLTISGTGSISSDSSYPAQWREHAESITKLVIEEGVTGLAHSTLGFRLPALEEVAISASVTELGPFPFHGCDKIRSFTLDENNPVYTLDGEGVLYSKDMTTLYRAPTTLSGDYVIPDGVVTVQAYSVNNCPELTSVSFPTSFVKPSYLDSVGFDNFNNCPRLKAFKFSEDNANYCSDESGVWFNKDMTSLIKAPGGLRGTYTVPESVRVITQQSFNTCEGLTGVIIPEGVTGIQPVAFSNCTSLREVRLPSTLVNIRSGAFMNCTSLESIDLLEGLTRIYEQVFYGCTSLKDVRLPESLEYIMEGAFTNCTSLESVFIPEGVIVIGGEWGTCAFVGCSSLKTFSVSEDNSVYSADGSGVLYDKSGRNIIEFPGGLTGEYTVSNSASIRGGVSFDGSNISVLRFTGHAPRYVFGDETLTVFYPANDPTWIYEQRLCELNHSGQNITWIPDESMETSFIPGDVDYNGIITNQDLITVARYAVGLITEAQLNYPVVSLFGDYNGDGEINNVDIIMIARSIVGIN